MTRALAALLLVALTAIAGCSSDDKPAAAPASSFADATCLDLAGWAAAVQPAFNDLRAIQSLDVSDKTATQARFAQLGREIDAAIQASNKLADGIDARPAPDVTDGDTIKRRVVEALRRLSADAEPVRSEIAAFDIATATNEQATQLRADLSALSTTVATSLTEVAPLLTGSSELLDALQNSPTCRQAASQLSS